jgi:hypothetical protein
MTDEQIEEFLYRLEVEYARRGWWGLRRRVIELLSMLGEGTLKDRVWPVLSDDAPVDTRDKPELQHLFLL